MTPDNNREHIKKRLKELVETSNLPGQRELLIELGIISKPEGSDTSYIVDQPHPILPNAEDDIGEDIPTRKDPIGDLFPKSEDTQVSVPGNDINTVFYSKRSVIEDLQEKLGIKNSKWIDELWKRSDRVDMPRLESVLTDLFEMSGAGYNLPKDRIDHLGSILYDAVEPTGDIAKVDMATYNSWKDEKVAKKVVDDANTSEPSKLEEELEEIEAEELPAPQSSVYHNDPVKIVNTKDDKPEKPKEKISYGLPKINLLPEEKREKPKKSLNFREYLTKIQDGLTKIRDGYHKQKKAIAVGAITLAALVAGSYVWHNSGKEEKSQSEFFSYRVQGNEYTWKFPKDEISKNELKSLDQHLRNKFGYETIFKKLSKADLKDGKADWTIGSEGIESLK